MEFSKKQLGRIRSKRMLNFIKVIYSKSNTINSLKELDEIPKKFRIICIKFFKENVEIIIDDGKYFSYAWSKEDQNMDFIQIMFQIDHITYV